MQPWLPTDERRFNTLRSRVDTIQSSVSKGLATGIAQASGIKTLDTIAELKLEKNHVGLRQLKGYHSAFDGVELPPYYADLSDTTSVDDGFSVIVADDGTRWKPVWIPGVITDAMFGAKIDGVTDDTVSCRNALNFAKGKVFEFATGTRILDVSSSEATLGGVFSEYSFFNIDASFNGTTIRAAPDAKLKASVSGNSGNGDNFAYLFALSGSVKNLTFENITSEGIEYTVGANHALASPGSDDTGGFYSFIKAVTNNAFEDITVRDNKVQFCLRSGIDFTLGSEAINLDISNNYLDKNRGHSIVVRYALGCTIEKNHITRQHTNRENPDTGADPSSYTGNAIDISDNSIGNVIRDNYIEDCVFGIKSERDETESAPLSEFNHIVDNTIRVVNENNDYGVTGYGVAVGADAVNVNGNIIDIVGGHGIFARNGAATKGGIIGNIISQFSDGNDGIHIARNDANGVFVNREHFRITNNAIEGPASGSDREGIYVEGSFAQISQNTITQVSTGINCNGSSGVILEGIIITDNSIKAAGDGIIADFCGKWTAHGNQIIETSGAGTPKGIHVVSMDPGVIIVANNIKNFDRGISLDTSLTDFVVNGNYLSGRGATTGFGVHGNDVGFGTINGNTITTFDRGVALFSISEGPTIFVSGNTVKNVTTLYTGGTAIIHAIGAGVPSFTAGDGSTFQRTDGGSGTTFYVREAGSWVAK